MPMRLSCLKPCMCDREHPADALAANRAVNMPRSRHPRVLMSALLPAASCCATCYSGDAPPQEHASCCATCNRAMHRPGTCKLLCYLQLRRCTAPRTCKATVLPATSAMHRLRDMQAAVLPAIQAMHRPSDHAINNYAHG